MASINDENYRSRIQQVKKSASIAAAAQAMSGRPGAERRAFQNITNVAVVRNSKPGKPAAGTKTKSAIYRDVSDQVVQAKQPEVVEVHHHSSDETEEEMLDDEDEEEEEDDDEDDEDDEEEAGDGMEDLEPSSDISPTISDSLTPFWMATAQDQAELDSVEVVFSNRPGIWDEEDEDTYDISMVAEYGPEIFQYMHELEMKMLLDNNYMDRHSEIHWGMRRVLLDWIVQVHGRFHLLPETLFLAVNYMDRFLSIKSNVSTNKLQLVGAVALFIAAKYEEINCPSVQEMVYMVENLFNAEQILKAEQYMINLLDFKLGWPGPMSFLRRTSKADDYELEIRTLAKYLLEITIMDQEFIACPSSYLAAAAHCMSRIMLERTPCWSDAHVYFAGYTFSQLKPGLRILWDCCKHPEQHHRAIYHKYQDRRFRRASLYVAQYMASVEHELPSSLH